MDVFESFIDKAKPGRLHLLRLASGDDLFQGITHAASVKKCRRMIVLSGVGTVCDVSLRNLKAEAELPVNGEVWRSFAEYGPFTIAGLSGNLTPMAGDPVLRLHATLSAEDGRVVGGQIDAATVFTSAEIFFLELEDSWVVKKFCPETGLAEMLIADFRKPEMPG